MRLMIIALLATANLAIATVANAEPCSASSGESTSVFLEGRDRDFFTGMAISLLLGLSPPTFPHEEIAANANACTRGEFEAGAQTYRVFGAETDSPPRWAVGADAQRIVYIAIIPPPHVALQWARDRQRTGRDEGLSFREPPLYVLAITNGNTRDIFAFYQDIPGDAQLTTAFKDALEGRLPRVATFNERTGETQFADR